MRLWFGAANVDVSSPSWLSGGFALMTGLTLPFNRLFIIMLASVSVAGMYWLLFRTDRGLTIRAVTQNRGMSSCLGVRAGVVDAVTFGLGAGLAGLAGAALTQVGNVGPSLGQNYIGQVEHLLKISVPGGEMQRLVEHGDAIDHIVESRS